MKVTNKILTMLLVSFNTHSHEDEWKMFAPNPVRIQLNCNCECTFQLNFLVAKFIAFFSLLPASTHADDGALVMGDVVVSSLTKPGKFNGISSKMLLK